jgi:CubicO group peptidase (beta-lactamase class C family)
MFRLISLVMISLVLVTPAVAEDTLREIDRIFIWATAETPGCAVAVSQKGKVIVNRAYGSADLERGVPLTPESVFDVGSVQKQFTAASILLMVEEGRLSLTEDIRNYLPELPDYGHRITLDHLLTHTSGIREWTGMLPLAEGDPHVLTLILRQRELNFAPGDEWSYSNSGYELLKEIVARASGMSFSDFTRTRLFEPLGMKSTAYHTDMTEIVRNRALAYKKEGERWKMDMYFGNRRGGEVLLTTATDLLIFDDALTNGRLGAFVSEKIHEPARLNNGRKLGYARSLRLGNDPEGRSVSLSGGAAGHSALLGRYPDHGLSIAFTCNADGSARGAYAARIFDIFEPPARGGSKEASKPAAKVADVEEADLSKRAGLFLNERTGEPLQLIVNDGRLRIANGPRLVAVGTDRFRNAETSLYFMSEDEFELYFISADQIELKSMEGETTRYRRARRYTPASADLQAFAGRYESDEIGSVLLIVPEKGGLAVSLEHAPERVLPFVPVDPDTFQGGRMMVRFRRGADGVIAGLVYSNPVIRSVTFTRLGEGKDCR